jgi:rubrerythrin
MDNINEILNRYNLLSTYNPKIGLNEDNDKYYNINLPELCAEIEKNIEAEADARKKYYNLINLLKGVSKEDIASIEEIISDELNHTEKLTKMLEKYSKIPTAKE